MGTGHPAPADLDIDAALTAVIGPAMDRLAMRFDSVEDYLAFWDAHPSLGRPCAVPLARRSAVHHPRPVQDAEGGQRSSCELEAVRADGADILADPVTHGAMRRAVGARQADRPRGARGLPVNRPSLYDEQRLAALGVPDAVVVTPVDANHYDVILDAPGTEAIADRIDRHLGRAR